MIESVAYADIENSARLVGDLLHFERFAENSRCGLFAENVFARIHKVNRYYGMKIVMSADRDRVELRVVQKIVIILNCRSAAVFFNTHSRLLGNYIAEIYDFNIFIFQISRNMRGVRDISAAYDCNFNLTHNNPSSCKLRKNFLIII